MKYWICSSNCGSTIYEDKTLRVNYPCNSTTECSPVIIYLRRGSYHLDLYGAAGGGEGNVHKHFQGGLGGHTDGRYTVSATREKFYLYLGGKGDSSVDSAKGGFNGGGMGIKGNGVSEIHGGGGGYTDIRRTTDPSSFIAIAGGGGGAGRDKNDEQDTRGGNGGGLQGEDGTTSFDDGRSGKGGTQTSGGDSKEEKGKGKPFQGGSGLSYGGSSGGGGGGGYYGGAGGQECGGRGGSGHCSFLNYSHTSYYNNDGNGYIIITPIFVESCTHETKFTIKFNVLMFIAFIFS